MPINTIGAGPWNKRVIPLTLSAGSTWTPPSGQYLVALGPYTCIQWYDPISLIWRTIANPFTPGFQVMTFDGYNMRIANLTGTCVGAYLTNGGSSYPNGIYPAGTAQTGSYVVATTTGGATFNVIVGGCISTTVTVTTAGVGYNYPPTLLFTEPPAGGVRASGTVTVSAGALSTVTVTNQGAGYLTAPTVTIVPDPRDLVVTGSSSLATNVSTPGVLTTTLTNSGRVTAITAANVGNGYSSAPSITITGSAGSSAAATAVMCFTVNGIGTVSGGSANQTAAMLWLQSAPLAASKTNAPVNPQIEQGLFNPRIGQASLTLSSGVGSAGVVQDGGLHQVAAASINQLTAAAWGTAAPTSSATLGTITTGGLSDTVILTAF
jgi:hypothetical protein